MFFVRNTIECDVPYRNVKALAVGSVFSSIGGKRDHALENSLRQRYDLHISSGKQNPCLVGVPEGEGFRGAVVPECGL